MTHTTALHPQHLQAPGQSGPDVCTAGAAQALLRPTRIHVDVSEPDEWGDVRIDVGPDERARLCAGVQWYRIDAPSSGGDPTWLTRGQLLALVAAAQALLEPRPAPRKRQAKAVEAPKRVRSLGPQRLRACLADLDNLDRPPVYAPLHDVTARDGGRISDMLTSRTGARCCVGLREDVLVYERLLDAPLDIPSGSHRVAPPLIGVSNKHFVFADVRREGC